MLALKEVGIVTFNHLERGCPKRLYYVDPPLRNKCLRVVLGISGGIDSSVSALILKRQGFDVHGLFMRNWNTTDESGKCSIDQDLRDADRTCSKLGIPLHEVDFSKDYWNYVFSDLLELYQKGLTPNPDVLCNRHIKFDKFVKYALEKLGAHATATGHYAQTTFGSFLKDQDKVKGVRLLKAVDSSKDQTFFLNQVYQKALQTAMFPLGLLTKSQVKRIANENNLNHVLQKKESTGICFIGRRNFSQFINEYLPEKSGRFINIDSGKVMGFHRGVHHWTLGQRARLGGYHVRPYIARISAVSQDILIALGKDHSSLWGQHLTTHAPNWIHSCPDGLLHDGGVLRCEFRSTHTRPLVGCRVMAKRNGDLMICLNEPHFALTPGQFAVLYKDNECLGGAQIKNTSPSLYAVQTLDKQNV